MIRVILNWFSGNYATIIRVNNKLQFRSKKISMVRVIFWFKSAVKVTLYLV